MHCTPCNITWGLNKSIPFGCKASSQVDIPKAGGVRDRPKATKIPIFTNHIKDEKHIVGWIIIENNIMTIEFLKGHEVTRDKMQDTFGCAAGQILQQTNYPNVKAEDQRIRIFRVTSWGYQ